MVDPVTLQELPQGESGEIVLHGPQLMQGYWRQPDATRDAFIELDGKRFLRSGDLGRVDEDGYYFMTDRLKRMINAAGYKVWPAEVEARVEALMYRHPAIEEVLRHRCALYDARRGETVKALVVLRPETRGSRHRRRRSSSGPTRTWPPTRSRGWSNSSTPAQVRQRQGDGRAATNRNANDCSER